MPIKLALPAILIFLTPVLGCHQSNDEKILEFTRQQADRQAEQHRELLKAQQDLTQASRSLVEADAQARKEAVAIHHEIQIDRNEVGRQRDALEAERKEIAQERHRDPIIAAAITDVGLILACMLPLALGFYVIHTLARTGSTDELMTEFLLQELTTDRPLLGRPQTPELEAEERPQLKSPE